VDLQAIASVDRWCTSRDASSCWRAGSGLARDFLYVMRETGLTQGTCRRTWQSSKAPARGGEEDVVGKVPRTVLTLTESRARALRAYRSQLMEALGRLPTEQETESPSRRGPGRRVHGGTDRQRRATGGIARGQARPGLPARDGVDGNTGGGISAMATAMSPSRRSTREGGIHLHLHGSERQEGAGHARCRPQQRSTAARARAAGERGDEHQRENTSEHGTSFRERQHACCRVRGDAAGRPAGPGRPAFRRLRPDAPQPFSPARMAAYHPPRAGVFNRAR